MSGRRRSRGHSAAHENEERWLLTYADMITLLMALFMVLFSISSVNVSKYQKVQQSLHAAFAGSILPGGKSIMQAGSESTDHHSPGQADIQTIVPLTPALGTPGNQQNQQEAAAQREQDDFRQLKRLLDAYAKAHGFADLVKTVISARGLDVQVLTDKLLFDSGQASLQSAGIPLLSEISNLLRVDKTHPVVVSGFTDTVPIHSSIFPTNWELSTARADTVVRFMIGRGVDPNRLTASGYAYLHPAASNATAAGQARNRRVEILLQRIHTQPASG